MFKIIIGVVIATIVVLIGMGVVENVINANVTTNTQSISEGESDTIQVSISGEVISEGTYTLDEDACMDDLIVAAGGVTSNADSRAYLSSALLSSGITYYIAPIYDNTDACATTAIQKVNVNTADKEALLTIDAFSETVAGRIVEYRTTNGDFETLESITNVSGIGPATYEMCKKYIYLHE